jgi:murein DD-endopeptidase MepM/ murein hydrolase activator NlpD
MKRLLVVAVLTGFTLTSFAFDKNPISTLSKSLVFPVTGKRSVIGSFWGAVRDGGRRKHEGIDIFARKGTPVVAICDGFIVSKGSTPRGGKILWLQSTGHPISVYYAHLDQHKVRNGQFVRKGQVIGTVGNTGNARYTPPHLHFGIYKFTGPVNPLPYVKNSQKIVLPRVVTPKSTIAKNSNRKIQPSRTSQAKTSELAARNMGTRRTTPSYSSTKR